MDDYLTYDQVRACHALYMRGHSLRGVAAQILPRTRYASIESCKLALLRKFRLLGLPRRDRIEATRAACTKHGLSPKRGSRRGYAAYRRAARERAAA